MRRLRQFLAAATLLSAAFLPGQVIVFGPTSRAQFDSFVTSFGTNFVDFESVPVGALSTSLQGTLGVTFASTIQTDGSPISPPHHAVVSTANIGGNATRKLVGTPLAGGGDDGRVGYTITFDTPQSHAGLLRLWQATFSLTRFYNSSGTLLGTHANTVNIEFVGWIANMTDPLTWVSRIEVDGLLDGTLTRQVGYSDDLFFGTAQIPEPPTGLTLVLALVLLGARRCCARLRTR